MRNNLLKELADLDQIIEKLESRRTDIVNMLNVIATLSTLGTPVSHRDRVHEKVIPISSQSNEGQSS